MTRVSTRRPHALSQLPMACGSQDQEGQLQGPSRGSPATKVSPQNPVTSFPHPTLTYRPREQPHPFAWRLCQCGDSDAAGGGTWSCGTDVPAPAIAQGLGMRFLLLVGASRPLWSLGTVGQSPWVAGALPAVELCFPSEKPSPSSFQSRARDRYREQAGGGRALVLQSHLPVSPVPTATQSPNLGAGPADLRLP